MYERSNIPVSKSVEEQSWWDIETSGGRGLDSVTLYRGFYVEIDNSPDMPLIWLGINTGFDSGTYCYEEYPKDTPLNLIKTEGLMKVDRLIAAPKLRLVWPLIELAVVRVKSTDRSPDYSLDCGGFSLAPSSARSAFITRLTCLSKLLLEFSLVAM
jgi:hypothetical protein